MSSCSLLNQALGTLQDQWPHQWRTDFLTGRQTARHCVGSDAGLAGSILYMWSSGTHLWWQIWAAGQLDGRLFSNTLYLYWCSRVFIAWENHLPFLPSCTDNELPSQNPFPSFLLRTAASTNCVPGPSFFISVSHTQWQRKEIWELAKILTLKEQQQEKLMRVLNKNQTRYFHITDLGKTP